MTILNFDGRRVQIQKQTDVNRDGVIDDIEVITADHADSFDLQQKTDVGEIASILLPNQITENVKMLGNIEPSEELYVLVFLMLRTMHVVPQSATNMVMNKLLISVSRKGRGRSDAVSLMTGKKEHEQMSGLRGFFSRGMGK